MVLAVFQVRSGPEIMRRSDWPYIVLTLVVFAISGSLFYSMGKRDGGADLPPPAEGPLVVVPLDQEAESLRQQLAGREADLTQLGAENEALAERVESLKRTTEILKENTAMLGDKKADAQMFYAREVERSALLSSKVSALEQSVKTLEKELATKEESILALERRLTANGESESLLVLKDPQAGMASSAPVESAGTAITNGEVDAVARSVNEGLLAYKEGRYEEAFEVWYPLAQKGIRRAQFYVGGLYHEGRGVAGDKIAAHYWLSLSNQAGYHRSKALLEEVTLGMSEDELDAASKLLAAREEMPGTEN